MNNYLVIYSYLDVNLDKVIDFIYLHENFYYCVFDSIKYILRDKYLMHIYDLSNGIDLKRRYLEYMKVWGGKTNDLF